MSKFGQSEGHNSRARKKSCGKSVTEELVRLNNPFVSVALVANGTHTVGGVRLVVASITWLRPGRPPSVIVKLPFADKLKPLQVGGGRSLTIT